MSDEKIVFSIDLDSKTATAEVSAFKKALGSIGSDGSTKAVADGFHDIAMAVGGAYAGFKVFQEVWDSLFEADRLRAIDASFTQLTKTFGISTEALRSGLEKASDGLIDTTDLLEIANRSMVAMGAEAQRLPEIMELARKASVITGQDVAQTFEQLSNAIATGNQRALKHMGIIVDVDKAYRDYSKSLGYSSDVLSAAGKQHALLNEVLEKGNKNLAGINDEAKENTNTWLRLKATLNDLKDTFVTVFEKTAGPVVRKFLDQLREGSGIIKNFFSELNGSEQERAQARITQIKDRISLLEGTIVKLTTGESSAANISDWFAKWNPFLAKSSNHIAVYNRELENLRSELAGLEQQTKKTAAAQNAAGESPLVTDSAKGHTDSERIKNDQKQLYKDLLQIQQTATTEKLLIMQTDEQAEEAMQYKRVLLAMQTQEQLRLIRENDKLSQMQKEQESALAMEALQTRLQDLANQTAQVQIQAAENAALRADGAWNKFSAGATLATKKAKASITDFAKLGEATINNFAGGVANAFAQVGAGAESMGAALKKAVINAIADIAFAKGSELIAASIFPPNPLGLAAGAGLTALSGVLRRLAGGGSSPSAPATGSAGAGAASPSFIPNSTASEVARPTVEAGEVTRRGVTLVVQGNLFDTEQTRTRIAEIVREASDATDFKIASVGGGL